MKVALMQFIPHPVGDRIGEINISLGGPWRSNDRSKQGLKSVANSRIALVALL